MFSRFRFISWARTLCLLFLIGTTIEMTSVSDVQARIGGGKSSGRPSGFGTRRYSPPPSSPPSTPSYGNHPSNPQPSPGMNPNRGGFLRGIAGGMAGGFLGSMLFNSMSGGGYGGASGGGGGFGLLELILFAGLAYWGWRWWKNRQADSSDDAQTPGVQPYSTVGSAPTYIEPLRGTQFNGPATVAIDTESATDIFFRVQGAWTRRNTSSITELLTPQMREIVEKDLEQLKMAHRINRLENITMRHAEVTGCERENECDYATVRFTANLLDYTVDEVTGQVVEGSDTVPVKFEEDWVFAKQAESKVWQLAGIQQV